MNKLAAGVLEAGLADEKIGIQRIRVVHADVHVSAIVGSFFAVDALLLDWSLRFDGAFDCHFEIEYRDGRTICGIYRFRRRGRNRPALMDFVRANAQALCAQTARTCAAIDLDHYALPFLDRYETEDFARA